MGISDHIAEFINQLLYHDDGVTELSRIELAERFGCVPSQINYVLSTRFSPEHGFIIESRRGGGGYIRITRVRIDRSSLIMHTVNAAGTQLDGPSARALLSNLLSAGALDAPHIKLIAAAVGDRALNPAPPILRDALRASIFKQCLVNSL